MEKRWRENVWKGGKVSNNRLRSEDLIFLSTLANNLPVGGRKAKKKKKVPVDSNCIQGANEVENKAKQESKTETNDGQ